MPVVIPLFAEVPLYTERVALDGVEYIFRFDWNNREQRWYMGIKDTDEAPLVSGVKLVSETPLTFTQKYVAGLPQGEFLLLDFETGGVPPGFSDIGQRVELWYYSEGEL